MIHDHNVTPSTDTEPVLSIIIVNWNGIGFLPRCLDSLRAQTLHNVQIMLVDNGSTDESVTLTREQYPEVDIFELGDNFGYAEANNRAAALSHARYLLFLNNDTYVDTEALAKLVSAAESRPTTPIWAPQQRTYDGTQLIHIGMGTDILGFPCEGKVFYADGAALFIRRDIFQDLGGFDPHYFMFFEEADLCWRARLLGYHVGIVPSAIIYHRSGGTAGSSLVGNGSHSMSTNKRRLSHRNQLITLLKNYSLPALCVILPLFALLTAGEVTSLAVTGQQRAIRESYLAAWRDLWHTRSYIRRARSHSQNTRRVADWAILRQMEWKISPVSFVLRVGVPKIK